MPARKSSTPPELTEGQAMYVVTRLIEDRRVSPAEVSRYVKDMAEEIDTLAERLRLLRDAQPRVRRGRRGRAEVSGATDDSAATDARSAAENGA
jgi:hypothetical protein